MKFFHISLFMIIFQLITSFLLGIISDGTLDGFTAGYSFHEDTLDEVDSGWEEYKEGVTADSSVTEDDWVTDLLGTPYEAVKLAVTKVTEPFERYVNTLPFILKMFGVPDALAYAISIPFYIFQIIGIAQLVTGRSFKDIE